MKVLDNPEIIRLLIIYGANIDDQDSDNMTALHWSAVNDFFENINELIECGANWNIKDNENKTFFDYLNDDDKTKISNKYPEQYKQYLMKEKAKKYNII